MIGGMAEQAAARGRARDVLIGIHNLRALLRSPKAGPRIIAPLLAEIAEGCRHIGDVLRSMLLVMPPDVSGDPVLADRVLDAEQAGADLAAAVARAEAARVDARARLSLEAAIERLAPVLEGTHDLVSVLLAGLVDTPLEIDVTALLEPSLLDASFSARSWGISHEVAVHVPKEPLYALASPSVALPYVLYALAHVASFEPSTPVQVEAQPVPGGVRVEVSAKPPVDVPAAKILMARLPQPPGEAGAVLSRVAGKSGVRIELARTELRVRVTFPGPIG